MAAIYTKKRPYNTAAGYTSIYIFPTQKYSGRLPDKMGIK